MRSFVLAAFLALLAVGTSTTQALAEGEVLVPDDTTKNTTPNLGLVPQTNLPPTAPVAPSIPSPYPSTGGGAPPVGMTTFPPPLSNAPSPNITMQSLQAVIDKMPHTTVPSSSATRIVNLPGSLQNASWNNIDVTVDTKWRPRSVTFVTNRLGLKDTDVPSACQIAVSGLLRTDKTSSSFDTGGSNHTTARYTGQLTGVMATVKALCNESTPLPADKGTIFQEGNKYVVSLGIAQCKPADPSKLLTQISVTFLEQGLPQCTVQ